MKFSEYGQVANPPKPRKGEPGRRRMRILETKSGKNNILREVFKNKPHIGKFAPYSVAKGILSGNNDLVLLF